MGKIYSTFVFLLCLSLSAPGQNKFSEFARSEIQRRKLEGLTDKHPIVKQLDDIAKQSDDDMASKMLNRYLKNGFTDNANKKAGAISVIEMVTLDARDEKSKKEAKKILLNDLAPLLVSGDVVSISGLDSGFMVTIKQDKAHLIAASIYKHKYQYTFKVKSPGSVPNNRH